MMIVPKRILMVGYGIKETHRVGRFTLHYGNYCITAKVIVKVLIILGH